MMTPIMDNGQWIMKRENVIKEKSFDFALRIVKLYKYLQGKKEFVLSKQLLRSGTENCPQVEMPTKIK